MASIVSISGIDGAGKTTQLNMLFSWLVSRTGHRGKSLYELNSPEDYGTEEDLNAYYEAFRNHSILSMRFFISSRSCRQVLNELMYSSEFTPSPQVYRTARILLNEAELWHRHVTSRLLDGERIILFDRYYFDEFAYRQLYGVGASWVESLYSAFVKPDLAIYLKLDHEELIRRNSGRKDSRTLLFESPNKLAELCRNFEDVAERHDMVVIDGSRSASTVHEEIVERIGHTLVSGLRS